MKNLYSKAELLAELDAARDEHVRFLQAFLRAPSPNPPGDTRAAADVVSGYLAGRGIDAVTIAPQPEMPNIVADCRGSRGDGKRLMLNGHIDVFPVGDAAGWTRDPWSGDLDEEIVHGRGATDMKSGTAASIIAFGALHARRAAWSGTLGLTAVWRLNRPIKGAPFGGATPMAYLTDQKLAGVRNTMRFILQQGLKLSMSASTKPARASGASL
jgi:hypothetical protein